MITVYFNCDDYITIYKKHLGTVYINGWKWPLLFFPTVFGPAELSGNGLYASSPCKINTVFIGYTQISLPTGCKIYILFKAPTCFGQHVWPENVGALCNIYIYVGNSISKLQIQVATYVFELSAGNCHRKIAVLSGFIVTHNDRYAHDCTDVAFVTRWRRLWIHVPR